MDELEPWNMFTSDYSPDDPNEPNTDAADNENSAHSERDLQVKEEPQDHEDENFEDDVGEDEEASLGFNSILHGDKDHSNAGGGDDEAIFDFGSGDNSMSGNVPDDPKTSETEDIDYRAILRLEDSIVYICPACGQEFRTQELWKKHLNGVHQYGTRRGLNFIQLDKLYHECLECNKRIAMHCMENLLKHKFTHLPYRCVKCDVCKRQYKYRQDLMIHLRTTHKDHLLALAKEDQKNKVSYSQSNNAMRSNLRNPPIAKPIQPQLTIGQVKENATDIFHRSDNIEVRNEVLDDEDDDDGTDSRAGPTPNKKRALEFTGILDEESGSCSTLGQPSSQPVTQTDAVEEVHESLEEYVLFICPQCASESESQSQWRQHIECVHGYGTRKGLNMRDFHRGQAQCVECNQIISLNTIRNLQKHKFQHLPRSHWMHCKICFDPFDEVDAITNHLASRHHLLPEPKCSDNNDEDSQEPFGFEGDEFDDGGETIRDPELNLSNKFERDEYEKHIGYLCPQCGQEFDKKKLWRKHIVGVHKLGDVESMNYEILNDRQLRCKECDKIITYAYGIQNAQQHRITHMQYKSFIKCRLCQKQYTDRKGLVKHLRSHGIGTGSGGSHISSPIPNFGKNMANSSNSHGDGKPKPYRPATYKEIVRHNNYVYEIFFLEEYDEEGSSTVNKSAYDFAKGDMHVYPKPPAPGPKSSAAEPMVRHRCVDCGSSFPSPHVLQHHIRTEHDFIDYSKSVPKKSTPAVEEKPHDTEDLLVPSSGGDVREEEPPKTQYHFIYICPQCGVEYRERHFWRMHINDVHNFDKREFLDFHGLDKYRFQCKTCHEVVQSSKLKGLQDHKFRHCPYRQYIKCLVCGQAYNHKPNMITHLRQRHNIIYSEPNPTTVARDPPTPKGSSFSFKPGKDYSKSLDYSLNNSNRPPGLKTVEDVISFHNAVDHESITYHCPSCNDTFESHVYWRKHIVEEHNLNSREGLHFRQLDDHHYICLQCYKRVTVTHTKGAIGQLQSHKFRHLPYKSFRCTVCKGEFVRKQMFFKHLDRATNKCGSGPQERAEEPEVNEQLDDTNNDSSLTEPIAGLGIPTENQGCFTLCCPQCGIEFESTRAWREHINIEHNLNNRTVLNFRKLNPKLHLCLECKEHVNGRKLRDLQVHKFKHLPYGSYLHCRFCSMQYYHISNMQEHLKNKHPQVMQNMKSFDEVAAHFDEDVDESNNFETGDYEEDDGAVEDIDDNTSPQNIVDIDMLEAEAEIEEVDPDNVESEEQYLLG